MSSPQEKTYEPERFRSQAYLDVIDPVAAPQTLSIAPSALQQMHDEAEAGYPLEVCGLLIGKLNSTGWQINSVRPVANLNEERAADRFQLDPLAYQRIDRELRGSGEEIVGVYHSHPDCPAKPSPTDLQNSWEGFAYPIISVCDGQVRSTNCWQLNDDASRFQQATIVESQEHEGPDHA